jgi:hypothetical protein
MTERDSDRRLSTTDRIYGAVAAIAIVLAAFFLFRGGGADATKVNRAPRLTIEDPLQQAEVAQPMVVTFDAHTALRPDGSDPAAGRHVHARVGASDLMPGTADVRPVAGTRYQWTLPRLPAGISYVRLYWSDASHRAIPGATSDSVPVTIR